MPGHHTVVLDGIHAEKEGVKLGRKRTFSRTFVSKFLSAATFTHTQPSFRSAVGTL